jgi:MFS transporter, FSR family, fosmidomycin resistance protein
MFRLRQARHALYALSAGHFVVDMQSSGLAILIPVLQAQLHLDYAAAVAIITAQTVTSSIVQPLTGVLSDRRPVREILPLACLLAGLGTAAALFMPTYALVLVVVIVAGLGSAAYHSLAALNANYVSGDAKATGMSVFFAGGQFGYAAGPLIMVGLLAAFGSRGALGMLVPAVVGAAIVLAFLPFFARGREWRAHLAQTAASRPVTTATRRRTIWGMTTIVLVICLRSVIQTGLIAFIPLYFTWLNPGNKGYAALLLSVFVCAGAIGTLFGGPLADRLNRKLVMVVSMGIVCPLLLIFLNSTGIWQVLAIAISGAALVSAASLTVVMAQELMPNNIGLAAGLTLGLGFGAGGLGLIFLGEIADAYGLTAAMELLVWLPLVLVLVTLLLPGRMTLRREPTGEPCESPAPSGAELSAR